MKTISNAVAKKILKDRKVTDDLFEQGYTIVMPKAKAAKWLKALRSGEYIQASDALHNPNIGGFCCLGVEQYCNNDGFVENTFGLTGYGSNEWNSFPSNDYLKKSGYLFVNRHNWEDTNPYINAVGDEVSDLNDDTITVTKKVNQHATKEVTVHKNDFNAMADFIEGALLVY